ncbi:MAG: S8 family serine peptidase [Phycisphaerae bacterium]
MNRFRTVCSIRLTCILILAVCAFSNISLFAQKIDLSPQALHQRQIARDSYVQHLAEQARRKKTEAENWARIRQIPMRHVGKRNIFELVEIRDGAPIYLMTHNVNAAISTAANLICDIEPYNVNGSGLNIGIWDAGGVLTTHQEFGSRVTIMDGSSSSSHSTHIGGTIGASGVVASAKGMAPLVGIKSYNWTNEFSEMAAAAASYPQEPGKIYVSNHSYGTAAGWIYASYSGTTAYHWRQGAGWSGASSVEPYFGQYDSSAREYDQIAYNYPYYLIFKSAGNDRSDNPEIGETVYYYKTSPPRGWRSLSYSTSVAPPGDGVVKGGYDTISCEGVAKNIITVGAVNDAVAGGVRDISEATMTNFSAWGPADDGRIKPDIVANGVSVYSTNNGYNSDYTTMTGTSMATPNAAGSAMLLVDYYRQIYPGQAMRSSTLKALIIHTADDLGNPGPDYRYGWGLMNAKEAADLIPQDRIKIGLLSTADPTDIYEVYYTGDGPMKFTLCWTDPPATAISTHDNPSPRLINDLDLRVIAPDDVTVYYPYILDPANPSAPATFGDNTRDNVEQVYIDSPQQSGIYKVQVSHKGTLSSGQQYYSLILIDSPEPQPPIAVDVTVSAAPDFPVNIILNASDDGLQAPPGALDYIILSLPQYGDLEDPLGGLITEVPYTLLDGQNEVIYTALKCYAGPDDFEFIADDGGIAPEGGESNIALVSIIVGNEPVVIFETDFEDGLPQGWTIIDGFDDGITWMTENPNSRTSPGGYLNGIFMLVDSDWAGYTDMNEVLITHSIDCSGFTDVKLIFSHYFKFYASVGAEMGDVNVRVNGGSWQNVARYTGEDFDETVEIDISVIADGEPNVQIGWHYYDANYDWFWAVDNVQIIATPVSNVIAGDFEPNCTVDFYDFGAIASVWLIDSDDPLWDERYDISEPPDGIIDMLDLAVLVENWLITVP